MSGVRFRAGRRAAGLWLLAALTLVSCVSQAPAASAPQGGTLPPIPSPTPAPAGYPPPRILEPTRDPRPTAVSGVFVVTDTPTPPGPASPGVFVVTDTPTPPDPNASPTPPALTPVPLTPTSLPPVTPWPTVAARSSQRLLFVSQPLDAPCELREIAIDGSADQLITTFDPCAVDLALSPDGAQLAFVQPRALYVLDMRTLRQRQLLAIESQAGAEHFLGALSWSPDGTRLAVIESQPRALRSQIDIVMADGSGVSRLFADAPPIQEGRGLGDPSWSPGGEELAFITYELVQAHITVARADGSGVTVLTDAQEAITSLCWSPDGSRMAFAYRPHSSSGRASQVASIGADGTDRMQLTDDDLLKEMLACSPDGRLIAFAGTAGIGDNPHIYLMRADGSDIRQIIHGESDTSPVWLP